MGLDQGQTPILEIAHVLFMDIVGYSKLPMDQQRHLVRELQKTVRGTSEFVRAQATGKLISLPTGDGMALVFFADLEAPVRCALELSRALGKGCGIKLRMGVHTGPVYRVADINVNLNVTGSGINIAQRVMDCGDAGHILASKVVVDVLGQLGRWTGLFHDLGEAEVKHDVRIHLFNLFTGEIGNPEFPQKLRPASSPSIRRESLAILPFENGSADPDAEYLSDGITESIINTLSQLPRLHVMARSTVFRYKRRDADPQTVGRDLKVNAVLTGRLVQYGDSVTVSAELVDVTNGWQLWGEQYNRRFTDIFAVQEEIAKEISEKLRLRLTSGEKKRLSKRATSSIEAYQLYLKGRYHWNKRTEEEIKKSIEYFHEAIQIDPSYAQAYAGLADSYATLGLFAFAGLPPKETMPHAQTAAVRALEIDDTLAEAHASLGIVTLRYGWDWLGAERAFKRAIELNPGYAVAHQWYGECLAAMGRLEEAIAELKHALELDPLSLIINAVLAGMFYFDRQYDLAIEQCRKTLEMERDFWPALFFLGLTYEQMEALPIALAALQDGVTASHRAPMMLGALGHAYASAGNHDEAQKVLDELGGLSQRRYGSPIWSALIYIGLGANDVAFAELEKAYEERSGWLVFLGVDPGFDRLRSDARFVDLIRRLGLTA